MKVNLSIVHIRRFCFILFLHIEIVNSVPQFTYIGQMQYNRIQGAQDISANVNLEKNGRKMEIIQKTAAAENGNQSTANRKFVNYNLA